MTSGISSYKNTPLLNGMMLLGCAIGGPIVAAILFIKWSDSPSRQIVGFTGIAILFVLALMRQKQNIFVLLIIFLSQFLVSLTSFKIQEPTTIPVLLLDIFLFLLLFSFKEIGEKFRLDAFSSILLSLVVWEICITFSSIHVGQSLSFVLYSAKAFLLYLVISNIDFKDRFYNYLPTVIASVIVIQGVIAAVQYLRSGYLGLVIIGEKDPSGLTQLYFDGALRASGTLGASNALGGYLSMLLVFLLPFIVVKKKFVYYLVFVVGLMGLYIPLTRAAWLSFIACSAIVGLQLLRLRQVKIGQLILMGGLVLIAVSAVAYFNWDKITGRFEDKAAVASAEGRYTQIPAAWRATLQNPLTGLGPGTTTLFGAWNDYDKYVKSNEKVRGLTFSNQFHSSILQYLVEQGLFGGLLFCLLIALVIYSTLRSYRRTDPYSTIKLAASAGALSYLISSQFGTEINNTQMMTLFTCLAAIANNRYIRFSPKKVMIST